MTESIVNKNLVRHSQWCWFTGFRNASGEVCDAPDDSSNGYYHRYFLRSEMIPVEGGKGYTLKAWSAVCLCALSFFDETGTFLSKNTSLSQSALQVGASFTSPSDAAYMEILSWLPMPPSGYLFTCLEDVGYKHLYKLEEGSSPTAFTPAPEDAQDQYIPKFNTRPKNDPEAARQLVSCAESYIGHGWKYGNAQTLHDTMTPTGPSVSYLKSDGVKQIDCLTLAMLAVGGIPYFQSKYFCSSFLWRSAKYYEWGLYSQQKFLEGFARWIYENGWEIDPGENYRNLQAGDLVFWGMNYRKTNYEKTKTSFRGIDHVGMFTGRWLRDTVPANGRSDDGLLHPQTIEISNTGNIVVNNFLDRVSSESGGSSPPAGCSVEFIQMFARIPLSSPYTEYDSNAHMNTNNVIYSSHYQPSVVVEGNGKRINIDIYGRNAAIWERGDISANGVVETSNQHQLHTNLVPVFCVAKNLERLRELGFIVYHFFWYDADETFISETTAWADSVPEGAAYYRLRYRKINATPWTDEDIALFKKHQAIQPYWRGNAQSGTGTALDDGDDPSVAQYPQGYHSYAYLETVIPSGSYIGRHNGRYAHTSDGLVWTELPEADQAKLVALRIGDGENNIYIPNGQHVKLTRRRID
ncbi:hypothetical protein [Synergistes jonesii]|uniref:Uncharacterized protein n=1 Tax=Synergistes jonesii TaxID=2754 RepID=A0A073IN38_9BACT|nr:hypothetical protein [Synergistes jonesii]KEJ91144.1 hypothetical protein EH55_13285 [Synergistes jonesii]OFB60252.1 hypothetical protein JS73_13095 [Synergistes jonesii]OFB60938.1 hypothetical protein JS79_12735 [Synergistes jonesii]OFB64621.1 hypothetical protein JS72_04035 [Synergistes jonesii]OFB66459.1 hypothetical protein JS78_13115 [Synergistes jonesii]